MRFRILWSLIAMFFVTLLVAGFAHASFPPVTEVGDDGASGLEFQNELQIAAKEGTTVAAMVGTQAGTAAEIAASAAEQMKTTADVAGDTAVTTENLELKAEVPAVRESAAPVAKAEAEIPVKLDEKQAGKTQESSLRELLLVFAVLAGFGLLAYLAVSKLKYRNQKTSQFQMKILAQHHLGAKKSLAVVRVAGESLLIGVTDHHISMIKSLALLDEEEAGETPADFRSGLESLFSRQQSVAPPARETQTRDVTGGAAKVSFRMDENAEGEDFTISQIRDVVTKQIRNMKALE